MDRRIIIVGGGASGLMAALAADMEGAKVTVVEQMERVGKKILSTGNGRCNLSNLSMTPECYRCSEEVFPMQVLDKYSVWDTLSFFDALGVLVKNKNGYVYPNSEQASAVLDVLFSEITHRGIEVLCGHSVSEVKKRKNQFVVLTKQGERVGDAVILAAGSRAAPGTGSDGSGYELARLLGHRIVKPLPALVQLRCRGKQYKTMAGVRCEARLTLLADGVKLTEEAGELQITDYGISGIPTFQISRYASVALDKQQKVMVLIDFLPAYTPEESKRFLEDRIKRFSYRRCEDLLSSVLNKKLVLALLKLADIRADMKAAELDAGQKERLLKLIIAYPAQVTETNSFEQAQVCCGGVDTTQVDPDTMESRLVRGVYFAGELLDVDGICGGYNLQWAWSTGMIAGRCAGRREDDSNQSNKDASKPYRGQTKAESRENTWNKI